MENCKLVMPEHLNHYGDLFGGNLLKWVDEYAWIAAALDFPRCRFVTLAMDAVEFRQPVRNGTILRFAVELSRKGRTSVQYTVRVRAGNVQPGDEQLVFSTRVTLVHVDEAGRKAELA